MLELTVTQTAEPVGTLSLDAKRVDVALRPTSVDARPFDGATAQNDHAKYLSPEFTEALVQHVREARKLAIADHRE